MIVFDDAGNRLEIRQGWVICPLCRRGKLMRVLPTTRGVDFPAYCKRCARQIVVSVE